MRATRDLKEEHGGIKVMLGILGNVCDRLDAGRPVDPAHLEGILEFLKVFVDRCHHAKEEDHLFPAMERAGVPKEGGPIGAMLHDHQVGRDYIRAMGEAVPGVTRGDGPAFGRFVRNARRYRELLLEHIEKEDDVLYPIAEARLPAEADGELVAAFQEVEENRVGHGRHEEFHRMMDRLKSIYGL